MRRTAWKQGLVWEAAWRARREGRGWIAGIFRRQHQRGEPVVVVVAMCRCERVEADVSGSGLSNTKDGMPRPGRRQAVGQAEGVVKSAGAQGFEVSAGHSAGELGGPHELRRESERENTGSGTRPSSPAPEPAPPRTGSGVLNVSLHPRVRSRIIHGREELRTTQGSVGRWMDE